MTRAFEKFSVVDVETTGFGRRDRICEIGIVHVSPDAREIIGEFETLVNPERDLGATHVHQIVESMVAGAPNFLNIASGVASELEQAVLVAHNLPFDSRMLAQEFERAGGSFDPGAGVCTLRLTGAKLGVAAQQYGIAYETGHRALADARVCAALFMRLFEARAHRVESVRALVPGAPPCAPAVTRGAH